MAKLPLTTSYPWKSDDIKSEDHELLERYLKMLIRKLNDAYGEIATIVNANAIEFVEQDAQPTPSKGRLYVWKDTDAGGGNPTHYLVYTDKNGDTVTFASEETA